MADYKISAVHALNAFLWDRLLTAEFFVESDYDGFPVPIIPTQEIPALDNLPAGVPYIVYRYSIVPSSEIYMLTENAIYSIYCDDHDKVGKIIHFIHDLFRRQDVTKDDVNDFLQAEGTNLQKQIDFKCFEGVTVLSQDPKMSEGGRYRAVVSVRYEFSYDMNDLSLLKE